MEVLSCLYGAEIVESTATNIGVEALERTDTLLGAVLMDIDCAKFYDLIMGINELVCLAYDFKEKAFLPDPKVYKARNVLTWFSGTSATGQLTIHDLCTLFTVGEGVVGYRTNLNAHLDRLNNNINRVVMGARLYAINNSDRIDQYEEALSQKSDAECVAHWDSLDNSIKKVFNFTRDCTDVSLAKYIYNSLGWGSVFNAVEIFDPLVIARFRERHGSPFVPV